MYDFICLSFESNKSRESESFLYLVMELVEGGTLKQAMDLRRKEGFGFTDDEIASIMKSLLNAVDYLHAKNIVHRDLKPENILISDPRNPSTLKVADFGLSLQHNHQPLTTHCGTLAYMAPELAIDHLYGKSVDIWSCGVIMFMLLNKGEHPFRRELQKGDDKFLERLKSPQFKFPENTSLLARNLVLKLCQKDPLLRYSAALALNHPFITRRFEEDIPRTMDEILHVWNQKQSLANVVKGLFFMHALLHKGDIAPTKTEAVPVPEVRCLTEDVEPAAMENCDPVQRKVTVSKLKLRLEKARQIEESLSSTRKGVRVKEPNVR
eukprot:TRINITY_DN2064_c0_g2_i6.p1 TRINITY_DN2064_c0_g2~~TRINITY_DN2064_c0_g2_i6.p1  ORF type:complete len:323 (+),score=35.97 TRINITY_DN2064_c0_g2_i6:383-1351(+)